MIMMRVRMSSQVLTYALLLPALCLSEFVLPLNKYMVSCFTCVIVMTMRAALHVLMAGRIFDAVLDAYVFRMLR